MSVNRPSGYDEADPLQTVKPYRPSDRETVFKSRREAPNCAGLSRALQCRPAARACNASMPWQKAMVHKRRRRGHGEGGAQPVRRLRRAYGPLQGGGPTLIALSDLSLEPRMSRYGSLWAQNRSYCNYGSVGSAGWPRRRERALETGRRVLNAAWSDAPREHAAHDDDRVTGDNSVFPQGCDAIFNATEAATKHASRARQFIIGGRSPKVRPKRTDGAGRHVRAWLEEKRFV